MRVCIIKIIRRQQAFIDSLVEISPAEEKVFYSSAENRGFFLIRMPKTKTQKIKIVENNLKNLKTSETVVLADFTGLKVNDLNAFRRSLKALGMSFGVLKKRLLKIVFASEKIEFVPKEFQGQVGAVFSPKNFVETAGVAFEFSKGKEAFKILGGFDLKEKKFFDSEYVNKVGQLPSREVLLGQLVGMLTVPMRKFLYVLSQKSQQTVDK